MSALGATGNAEPPSKRRRVHDDSVSSSTPRYGSTHDTDADPSRPDESADLDERPLHGVAIRQGRPSSRSSNATSRNGHGRGTSYRSTSTGSRHSGSPSRPSSRSPQGRDRSRLRSGSRSRSASSTNSNPSRPRSRSRSPPRPRSASSTATSSSRRRSQGNGTPSRSPRPPSPGPVAQPALRPAYRCRLELRGHAAAISQVRISPDGRWIASASADGTAKIWDAETGAHLDTLVGHMAGVSCVAWAPDSNTLATGSDDKGIRLWDRVTASPAHACGDEAGRAARVARANGLAGGGLGYRSVRGGPLGRGPLLGHHNYVYCLAFSPKGNILASGSYDEAVFLWDVRAGRLMRSLPAHSDPVSGIDFCPDGTLVVSCSTDGLIRIWDTSTGQCLRTLVHEDNPAVANVCFSPNGRFVLAFSLDSCIRLWDFVSGTVKKTYQGHSNSSFSTGGCFGVLAKEGGEEGGSGCGALVAAASEDGDIVLWDVKNKEITQRIKGAHRGVCFWVDVHGDTMVSAGKDKVIRIYRNKAARKTTANGTGRAGDGPPTDGAKERAEDSGTPDARAAEEALQRHVAAENASHTSQDGMKVEET